MCLSALKCLSPLVLVAGITNINFAITISSEKNSFLAGDGLLKKLITSTNEGVPS